MMVWSDYAISVLAGMVLLPYLSWVGITLFRIRSRLAALEIWRLASDREDQERLVWLREMDGKLSRVAEDTAEIKGLLKASGKRE